MKKIAVAVLISGTGSNLKALIDACKDVDFPAEIKLVISNKPDAFGLKHAEDNDIPTAVISHIAKPRSEFEQEIFNEIVKYKVDLICLAGFMRVLSAHFFELNSKDIINIHPSLLPKFKGANAIADALEAGATETGCTVHYVIPEIDSGEIITQKSLPILESDDFASLKEKIHKLEHQAYVEALAKVAKRKFS